jgi:hypothetical protein
MTAQKAQADMLLHRLHYALPGWDAAAERRDAQDEFHSAAQARAWPGGDFDADRGLAFDGVGRPAHWSRARGLAGAEVAASRAPLVCLVREKQKGHSLATDSDSRILQCRDAFGSRSDLEHMEWRFFSWSHANAPPLAAWKCA